MTTGPARSERRPRVVAVGVLILDVLARPVTSLPPPERAHLLEEVRLTAAGTAAATAVDLARLGCDVKVCGAVGDDAPGELLVSLLERGDVDVSAVRRLPGVSTSVSLLPVTAAGERFTWHLRGANASYGASQVPADVLADADALHVGGPDALTGFGVDDVDGLLQRARRGGAVTSMDLLSPIPSMPGAWMQQWAPSLTLVSLNEHQAMVLTGADDGEGAAAVLHAWGAEWAAVTLGPHGCALAFAGGVLRVAGFDVPVIDTTGCGDAFGAALLVARLQGRAAPDAAVFANAAAALVATGLGSDAGLIDAAHVDEFAAAASR